MTVVRSAPEATRCAWVSAQRSIFQIRINAIKQFVRDLCGPGDWLPARGKPRITASTGRGLRRRRKGSSAIPQSAETHQVAD